jgi:hypothetical protein
MADASNRIEKCQWLGTQRTDPHAGTTADPVLLIQYSQAFPSASGIRTKNGTVQSCSPGSIERLLFSALLHWIRVNLSVFQ